MTVLMQSVDVAKVLYVLANKIESGQVIPRQVVLGETRFEMEFDQVYRLDERQMLGRRPQ